MEATESSVTSTFLLQSLHFFIQRVVIQSLTRFYFHKDEAFLKDTDSISKSCSCPNLLFWPNAVMSTFYANDGHITEFKSVPIL